MGQTSSRVHRQPESPRMTRRSDTHDRGDGSTSSSGTASVASNSNLPPQSGSSRRQSVRRSILNFVKPSSSSSRDRTDSNASSLRKSWRHSRRWSKAPSTLNTNSEPSDASEAYTDPTPVITEKDAERGSVSSSTGQPVGMVDSSTAASPTLSTSSEHTPESSEGSSEETSEGVEENDAEEGAGVTAGDLVQNDHILEDIEPAPDPAPALPSSLEGSLTIDETSAIHPSAETGQEQSASDQTPSTQPAQASGRQFPPPGTLVVVQGVVHTTDVPRHSVPSNPVETPAPTPRSSSLPPSPSSENTRNRLSSLLRSRPASTISPRPSSALDTSPPPISAQEPTFQPDESVNDPLPSRTASRTELPNWENANPTSEPTSIEPQPGTISSSSIDVLGTLLSVAAAATAASLLTGTTEPMLPPNIGPPPYNANPPPMPQMPGNTAPLPNPWPHSTPSSPINGLGSNVGTDPAAAGRAERLRHAWGSIRERLGLRPNPPPPATSSLPGSEAEGASGMASNDPRELVLAQMARAFNLGFGLGDNPSTSREGSEAEGRPSQDGSVPLPPPQSEGASQLPPDGSFERFLVDLQADLRVALTNAQSPTDNSLSGQEPPHAGEFEGDSSDSESEYHHIHEEPEDDDATISAVSDPVRSPTPAASLPPAAADPTEPGRVPENPDTDSQGRINWWRLYRFPPITTRTPGVAVTTPPTPATPYHPSTTHTTPAPESNPSPEVINSTLMELPFANVEVGPEEEPQERTHVVVPVIVVGLQSVNTSWPSMPPMPHTEASGEADAFDGSGEDSEQQGAEGTIDSSSSQSRMDASEGAGRPTSRGRAWHSRAAEALRNLRPGRRNRTTPAPPSAGSRTFLIYVIGGYYPPDHSIVTGGPNTLDSFEALLELAELLGQVKPPTVSKEDIEKSGLETIRASQLEEYERDQKISSNCTERCLICLDDYAPEEEIRVMKCRHAFHMTCVDKWLETGRNNCPACRSKGVTLDA